MKKKNLFLLVAIGIAAVIGYMVLQPTTKPVGEDPKVVETKVEETKATETKVEETKIVETKVDKPMNYSLAGDINNADPNFRTLTVEHELYRQIYEPLYFFNHADGKNEPRLAESYTISEDGLTYTFVIKKGVKFHNGKELKAEDVVFTVEKAAKSTYIGTTVANFESARVVDDYTAEIKLSASYASFFENVTQLYILPKAYYEEVGEKGFSEKPIGCGAYKLASRSVGSSITLEAFADYYRGAAPIKTVNMMIFNDLTAAAVALETGEINMMSLNPPDVARFSAMPNIQVVQLESPHITCVHMNTEVPPFDNPKVRQAVNYAINRDFMVRVAVDGLGKPSSNIVSPMMLGYNADAPLYDYNIEKAKQLLAEAGIETPMEVGVIGATRFGEKVAPILQENLKAIGLEAGISVTDIGFMDEACKGNYTIGIMGLVVYNGVAWDMDAYSILFDSKAIDAFNLPRINNPRIDELFKLGRSATNEDERLAYYKELNDIVQSDSGWAMLYHRFSNMTTTKNLSSTVYPPSVVYFYECKWNDA